MITFRKKPIEIKAVQFVGGNVDEALRFTGTGAYARQDYPGVENIEIRIHTLEGEMKAIPGDWIIRGVQGEFYPCKPDIFAETYEAVEEVPEW